MKLNLNQKRAATGAVLLLGAVGAAMATDPTTPIEAITSAVTTIGLIIGAFGVGLITLKLATVGWVVGGKFVSKLRG